MLKKFFGLTFGFYFLALFQTSFLIHFIKEQRFFSPILILVAIVAFLEKREAVCGFLAGLFGGFFLDMFSGSFIGFHILILIFLAGFIKFFVKKYVYFPKFS